MINKLINLGLLFAIMTQPLMAQDEDETELKWKLRAGVRESVSTGLYSPAYYTKPYVIGGVNRDFFNFYGGTSGLIAYPLYDGNGDEKKVNLYRVSAEAGIWYINNFGVSIRYERGGGESSYSSNEITGSTGYMGETFSLDLDLSYSTTSYEFNGKIDTDTISAAIDGSWSLSDDYSLDAGLTVINTTSDALDLSYQRRTLRGGISGNVSGKLFLMTGISYGWDTSDYSIYGFDASLAFFPSEHVKLTLMYMISYNEGSGILSSGSAATSGSSILLESGSYMSQRLMIGVEGRL